MNLFKNPSWASEPWMHYHKLEDVPDEFFDTVNRNLDAVQDKENPLFTILIPAWNEEVNIVRCLHSLSKNKTKYPFDIIVINNNSTDRTQETLDRLHVKSLFQVKQGSGPARQLGQENALGKYILLADADCIYPPDWIELMATELLKEGTVCVYGRYSFIAAPGKSRLQYKLFEMAKDFIAEIRHVRRPHLNAFGMSMGYVKEYGLKAGYIDRNIRGEDGRLCFDMMQYGKVRQVRSSKARVWTGARTLERDGSLLNALFIRVVKEILQLPRYFVKQAPHDTKTSENDEPEVLKYLRKQ
jgi:glycosyltransferase involved in cell wall biosynthesis